MKMKVLIVEDEVVIALDIQSTLEKMGYDVCGHLTKGEDVISYLATNKPDIVLMDIKLAGKMDGIEVAQIIRDQFHIPVIFLTSYSNKHIIERAKLVNPFGYLVKPFDDKELYTSIEIALYKHKAELDTIESERKYRELAESISQIVFEIDINGNIKYLNEAGMLLLNVTKNEIEKGVNITEFTGEEIFNSLIGQFNAKSHLSVNREYLVLNRSGRHIYVEENITPFFSSEKLVGFRGVLFDITAKRLKENMSFIYKKLNLKYGVERVNFVELIYDLLGEFISIFFYIEDIYFNEVNEVGDKVIVHSIENRKIKHLPRELSDYILNVNEPVFLKEKQLDNLSNVSDNKCNRNRLNFCCGFPLYIENIRFGVFVMQSYKSKYMLSESDFEITRDFFNSLQALIDKLSYLQKLSQSRANYKNLVHSINEGIIQMNFKNEITFVNNQLCDILECESKNLKNKIVTDVIEFAGESDNIFKEQIINNKNSLFKKFHLQIKTRKKGIKDILLNISPLIDEDGKRKGVMATVNDITERLDVLNKLNESENRFQAIFEQAAVGVVILEMSTGRIISANHRFMEILKLGADDLSAYKFSDNIYPDDKERFISNVLRIKNNEVKEFAIEYRHYNKRGEITWIMLTMSLLKSADNKNNYLAIFDDITIRKKYEEKININEREKERLLNAIPESFIVVNANNIITNSYLKKKEFHLFKSTDFFNTLKKIDDVIVNALVRDVRIGIIDARRFNDVVNIDRDLNIKERDVYVDLSFISMSENSVLVIIKDITDHKNKINEIKKLFNITEQTKELVMITDVQGRIEYINPMFAETTGYTLHELRGKLPSVLKSNKHPKSFYALLWKTILSGKPYKVAVTNLKKSGEYFVEEKIITPVFDDSGKIMNFISTGRDVTEEKRKERKIAIYQKFEKILEKKEQKSRTMNLIQGQERERKRIAREIHDGLGQMLTLVSSQLQGIDQKIKKSDVNGKRLNIINEMITEIINESRRISQNLSPGGLYEFGLDAVVRQLVDRVGKINQEVKIHYESNIKGIRFKPELEINLFRVIQELIQNSFKHSECTIIKLKITLSQKQLSLDYCDNGKGMDQKTTDLIEIKGNGLRNIAERIHIIDGTFNVNKRKRKGFEVSILIKANKL